MIIIYSLNSLVNSTRNTCEMKYKFYVYQNSNFIFIEKINYISIKNKILLYKKSNDIFNKILNFISIKNQIQSLSKIKINLYQKS